MPQHTFYENPLLEGDLAFLFAHAPGATRFERWPSHLHGFQQLKRKAVDFIFPCINKCILFFAEVKDFQRITREGRYGKGEDGIALAEDVARKFHDTINSFDEILHTTPYEDERQFATAYSEYRRTAVFHWEQNDSLSQQVKLHNMKTMRAKLEELLHGLCLSVSIESMTLHASKFWKVTRLSTMA